MDKTNEVLTRGVSQILPSKTGLAALMKGKRLTLYQGFDPSMASLHLGNFVGLMKLRAFQKLGHKIIFLVGDFTGMIGDPTDKKATRRALTRDEVLSNSKNWKKQVSSIISFDGENPAEMVFNSKWSDKLTFKDLIGITSNFTVQQMIERDMFQDRLKSGKPIHLHEFLYPVAQAIDCVELGVDLEVGGSDQIFNMLAGRTLMKALKNREKYVLATKLLVDDEGAKIGKTTGNALFLDSTPNDFYGGIMSFPDEVIFLSFELLTELPLGGLEEKIRANPLTEKKHLAFEVVKLLWGEASAKSSQENFEKTFQNKEIPVNVTSVKIHSQSLPLLDLVFSSRKIDSRSEVKRLISQNAVEIDGRVVTNPTAEITIPKEGINVKIGKKVFFRVSSK